MVNFHDTLWHSPSRSVGAKFVQCSRMVHASGTKVMRATNFEIFKILSTTWHAPPHTSRTVHAPLRRLYAMARSEACHCGDKMRASVNVAFVCLPVLYGKLLGCTSITASPAVQYCNL